jgi:hypothetical protein
MTRHDGRLQALDRPFAPTSPPGYSWRDSGHCASVEVHFVGPDDPAPPQPAATCATCGRRRVVRTYLIKTDAGEPPIVPESVLVET